MIKSVRDLCYNYLKVSPKKLKEIIEDKSTYYTSFQKPKKDKVGNIKLKNGQKQYRVFNYASGKLKAIQKNIKKSIFDNISLPEYLKGGVKNECNIKNAVLHKGKKYKFLTDICNFFPSVTEKQVFDVLKELGFSGKVSQLLVDLTMFNNQIPQGNITSSFLANIAFLKVDRQIIEIIKEHDIYYTRFLDDLTFSSPNDFSDLKSQIIQKIYSSGFKINRDKTKYRSKKTEVTGILVGQNNLRPDKKFSQKKFEGLEPQQVEGNKNYIKRINSFN